jgi:hypothetical protein
MLARRINGWDFMSYSSLKSNSREYAAIQEAKVWQEIFFFCRAL